MAGEKPANQSAALPCALRSSESAEAKPRAKLVFVYFHLAVVPSSISHHHQRHRQPHNPVRESSWRLIAIYDSYCLPITISSNYSYSKNTPRSHPIATSSRTTTHTHTHTPRLQRDGYIIQTLTPFLRVLSYISFSPPRVSVTYISIETVNTHLFTNQDNINDDDNNPLKAG